MKLKQLVLIPLVATLAACGSGAQVEPGLSAPAPQLAVDGKPVEGQPVAGAKPAASAAADAHLGAPAPAVGKAQAAPAPGAAAATAQTNQGASALPPVPPINRMVIKNATLSISVEDPEASLSDVDRLLKTVPEATIASQTVRTQNEKTFVNMVIHVRPDAFEDTLAKLRDLRAKGTRVLNDTVSSQDVTEQYTDLEAQYRNLQATRDAYQKLLDKATSVADIITLTREVANIQTQMDQIKGRQNLLSRQSAVSVINLSLSPVGATPPPSPRPLPQPVQAANQAWQALLTALQGFAVVLVWMAILLPIPALLLVGGWLIYRRATRPAAAYQAGETRS
jgi:hypothetical protein